ncbi:Uncharacterised protein [Mycobacterium tuberculosis]|nr:Uncharacterised protein [Mycobacterium tuberculosis]CKV33103.1 Uncharacterised protein [Mycobacterium tuberculosis]
MFFQEFDKGCFVVCLALKLLEFKSIGQNAELLCTLKHIGITMV